MRLTDSSRSSTRRTTRATRYLSASSFKNEKLILIQYRMHTIRTAPLQNIEPATKSHWIPHLLLPSHYHDLIFPHCLALSQLPIPYPHTYPYPHHRPQPQLPSPTILATTRFSPPHPSPPPLTRRRRRRSTRPSRLLGSTLPSSPSLSSSQSALTPTTTVVGGSVSSSSVRLGTRRSTRPSSQLVELAWICMSVSAAAVVRVQLLGAPYQAVLRQSLRRGGYCYIYRAERSSWRA